MTLPITRALVCPNQGNRRSFIGGSDARIIMGTDEAALLRLWQQKRGKAAAPEYSDNLIVQLGLATEPLNRRCAGTRKRPVRSSKTFRARFGTR